MQALYTASFVLLGLFFTSLGKLNFAEASLFPRNSTGLTNIVTWDPRSLSILGQRVFILSAEVHQWRLPGNPNLYNDIFEKVKSNGFNTISVIISWTLHFPSPNTNDGDGDFQADTYRDVQKFIDAVGDAGLWMIARPGPYINAETTGGGIPGWAESIGGDLRTDNSNYTDAWTPWLNRISKIIAKNQITEGGPIILVQAENEFNAGPTESPYMQAVIDTYRANGVVVPITTNDKNSGQTGNFSPDLPGLGRVYIYCGDSYPQTGSNWTQVQTPYYSFHEAVAFSNPLCLAEFEGGFLLNWGIESRGGTGFEMFSNDLASVDFENVFYKDAYAQTTTIFNVYMVYGGTNWGQTAAPVSYSSYDYGAAIDENRVARPKANEMRLQGLFLRVSRDLFDANLLGNGTNYTTSTSVHTTEVRNLNTGTGFYVLRQNDSTSTALTTTKLSVVTSQGAVTIPRIGGNIVLNGRESKFLVVDYPFGRGNVILYSTAEIMTWSTIGATDYVIFYAPRGQTGETAFTFSSKPEVVSSDASNTLSRFSNGILTLQYPLQGAQSVRINHTNGTIVAILMDKDVANQWHAPIIPGNGPFSNYFSIGSNETVLIGGPYLLRNASVMHDTLFLNGDLNGTTTIECIVPPIVSRVLWNGAAVNVEKTSRGTLLGVVAVNHFNLTLPSLVNWKASGSLPEIDPEFDDSHFTLADQTQTNYTNLPPLAGTQVLYAQQYGFYGGNLIFRGRFNATGDETALNLTVQYGFAGGYSVWLNGVFLGSGQGNATISLSSDIWALPDGALRIGAENLVVVVQDHMGLSETSTNGGKEPRGIRGYSLIGGNTTFSSWRLQGNQGSAAGAPDTFRGYLNEGGLYAERIGAHLPGYPDETWVNASPFTGLKGAGINFYRTTFTLEIPDGFDVPVRLSFTPSAITSNYRVQIYLNGWQIGKYVNNLGPQIVFVLPAGILFRRSSNTLALSLWSLDAEGASIDGLEIISDGVFSTALKFEDYKAPDYEDQKNLRPRGITLNPM